MLSLAQAASEPDPWYITLGPALLGLLGVLVGGGATYLGTVRVANTNAKRDSATQQAQRHRSWLLDAKEPLANMLSYERFADRPELAQDYAKAFAAATLIAQFDPDCAEAIQKACDLVKPERNQNHVPFTFREKCETALLSVGRAIGDLEAR